MASKKQGDATARRFLFTSAYPILFTDLELGKDVTVERAVPVLDFENNEIDAPSGSTLVARPGDILTPTSDAFVNMSAWLTEIDADGAPIAPAEVPPVEIPATTTAAAAPAVAPATPVEIPAVTPPADAQSPDTATPTTDAAPAAGAYEGN